MNFNFPNWINRNKKSSSDDIKPEEENIGEEQFPDKPEESFEDDIPAEKESEKEVEKEVEEESKREVEKESEREAEEEIEIEEPSAVVSRRQYEDLKIKEGKIAHAEYRDLEYTKNNLGMELEIISEFLLATSEELKSGVKENIFCNFESGITTISQKTGLSEEEIWKIYKQNSESLEAEAKTEINKSTSLKAKIAKTALKSGIYIGAGFLAGTSTAATLGLGAGVGVSVIAAARVFDRFITEKIGAKKLSKKIEEVKKSKTDDDRKVIQERLAAAISLRKKIEIDDVNLFESQEDLTRIEVIDKYIDEQEKAGSLGISSEDIPAYKEKMRRVMVGLDQINWKNDACEEKINKKSWMDKLQNLENKISGDTVEKKTISSAVLIGAGLAARSIPGVRQVLMGYIGWKAGGAIIDYRINKMNKKAESDTIDIRSGEITNMTRYRLARLKLLDHNFREKDPTGYLELKEKVAAKEEEILNMNKGVENLLNNEVDEEIALNENEKKLDNLAKISGRFAGAMFGAALGEGIKEIGEHFRASKGSSGDVKPEEIIDKTVQSSGFSPSKSNFEPDSVRIDSIPVGLKPNVEELTPISSEVDLEGVSSSAVRFEDEISNTGLRPGQHDSVWRSTMNIFKTNAPELGYQGDVNDEAALDKWASAQTVKTINNSGDITDKVFEGNRVILEKNVDGNYNVSVEQGEGGEPGHLPQKEVSVEKSLVAPKVENDSYSTWQKRDAFISNRAYDDMRAKGWEIDHSAYKDPSGGWVVSAQNGDDTLLLRLDEIDNIKDIEATTSGYIVNLNNGDNIYYSDNSDSENFYQETQYESNTNPDLTLVESPVSGAEIDICPNTDFPQGFLDYFAINPNHLEDLTPSEKTEISELLNSWNDNVEYIKGEATQLFQKGYSGKAEEFFTQLQTIKGAKLTDNENGFWAGILNSCNKDASGRIVSDVIKEKIEEGLNKLILY